MAIDRAIDSAALESQLTQVADAIRAKAGSAAALSFPDGFRAAIAAIETGGGLPEEIAELTYGTYTSASAVTGASVNIAHGLSGKPHLFAFILDADFSAEYPVVPDAAIVMGVSTMILKNQSGEHKTAGVHTKFAASGTTYASVNPVDAEYAHLGGTIVSGRTYRWIAVRFAV